MIIFSILILIMSVVVHEVSHGYVANLLGDPTARLQGRLTLNPIKHLEWFGSFFVPLITSFAGLGFGWAKPVPFNPYNFKNRRRGELLVALAGPVSNVLIALFFSILIKLFNFSNSFEMLSAYIIMINISLAIFNMVPIPPLDGSKVLFNLLPQRFYRVKEQLESYGFILVLVFIVFGWRLIEPIIRYLFALFV